MGVLAVTLDTNVLDAPIIRRIEESIRGLAIDLAHTSVTARELEGTQAPRITPVGQCVLETGIWGESRYDQAVYAGETGDLLDKLLALASNGSFPASGKRIDLTKGQRNQLRDMMILEAHVRSKRHVLVTNEKRAFVGKDGALRSKLEGLCSTRIMDANEFCTYCGILRREQLETR